MCHQHTQAHMQHSRRIQKTNSGRSSAGTRKPKPLVIKTTETHTHTASCCINERAASVQVKTAGATCTTTKPKTLSHTTHHTTLLATTALGKLTLCGAAVETCTHTKVCCCCWCRRRSCCCERRLTAVVRKRLTAVVGWQPRFQISPGAQEGTS
jgi:hypothetical protein